MGELWRVQVWTSGFWELTGGYCLACCLYTLDIPGLCYPVHVRLSCRRCEMALLMALLTALPWLNAQIPPRWAWIAIGVLLGCSVLFTFVQALFLEHLDGELADLSFSLLQRHASACSARECW